MIYHPNAQIAPQKCIPLSIAEAMDADEHAHNLTDWQQTAKVGWEAKA